MRSWLRVGLMIAALGSAGGASGQEALTQRDGQGAVPSVTQRGPVRIVVRNVGGIGDRVFVWRLPAVQ